MPSKTTAAAQHYTRHVRRRHLDIGPGTGYFLERARLPADTRVVLLDGGVGLGLYSCREIVARHGGQIGAACPEDGGTSTTVTLPMGVALS